jgi:hypothetical protein
MVIMMHAPGNAYGQPTYAEAKPRAAEKWAVAAWVCLYGCRSIDKRQQMAYMLHKMLL